MNVKFCQSTHSASETAYCALDLREESSHPPLQQAILQEMQAKVGSNSRSLTSVAQRIAREVERVCSKSARIQNSGDVDAHLMSLGNHRVNKCLSYYQKGSQRGRSELHAHLSMMVYRHIARPDAQLGFSARYNAIEDFLQDFYMESLRAFRKENEMAADYQPRTPLELAEYMAFSEQYAKRRITLPNGFNQQLVILRAQNFARRQPKETAVDIEQATEYGKGEEGELQSRSPAIQQVRAQMVAETPDPWENVRRDRVVNSLIQYLESQGHTDCADYLVLKLEDRSAAEIDEILGLTPRQRDYLQQRFKYHVEKFSRASENWKLVHQWLGADLDQKLGLNSQQWETFLAQLSEVQQQLLQLKQQGQDDAQISKKMGLSAKKLQKQWTQILEVAASLRNSNAN